MSWYDYTSPRDCVISSVFLIECSFCVLVNADLISAKELLVLATSTEDQKQWVIYLSKKIVRKEPKAKSASVRYDLLK